MKKFNPVGFITAIISFGIGTLFLISYAISRVEEIAFLGYFYLVGAVFINLLIAIILFIQTIYKEEIRTKNLKTIALMLVNIPIAYLYVIIVFDFLHL